MDIEIELLEDPYIGLRLAAWQVQQLQQQRRLWRYMRPIAGAQGPSMLDIWTDIGDFLRALAAYLDPRNWWGILYEQTIKPMVEWMGQNIFLPLRLLWERLQGLLLNWWAVVMKTLHEKLDALKTGISDMIEKVSKYLREHLTIVFAQLSSVVSGFWLGIVTKIHELIERFKDFIGNLKEALHERITVLIQRIVEAARGLRERLSLIFGNLIERLRENLRDFRERMWEAIMEWVRRFELALERRLSDLWNTLVIAIRQWWRQHGPQILEAANKAIKIARPYITEWVGEFRKLPATYLGWIASTAGTDLALHPSRSLAVAGSLYVTSLVAGSAAMALATALNIIPATNWVGAQQFAAYISQAAGFEPLTKATYGVLINEVLAIPLRYHWNMQLRPRLPTEGEIFVMGRKHGIDYAQFKTAMGYMGIPDMWIDLMYDFFWTDPSPMWLLRMSEGGIPKITDPGRKLPWLNKWLPGWRDDPLAWLKMKLMLAGYEDIDINPMIEGIQKRGLGPPKTQLKTSIRAMRREAYWDDDDVRKACEPLGLQPQEVQYLIMAEELDYQNKYMDEQVALYVDAFRKETIDTADLRVALSTIIVRPARVSQIIAREQIRKLPKPKPPPAPKEDPIVAKTRAEKVAGHIAMFRKRVIGPGQLYTYLIADGLAKALARATAIRETVSRIKAPPLDSPYFLSDALQRLLRENIAKYDDLWKEGKITIGEYLKALMAMGLDEGTATYLADVAILDQFLENLSPLEIL